MKRNLGHLPVRIKSLRSIQNNLKPYYVQYQPTLPKAVGKRDINKTFLNQHRRQ